MSTIPVPLDISNNKDLLRLAEEVRETKTPRILKKDDETVAVLIPAEKKIGTQAQQNQKAIEETLALAGTLSDLDWIEMESALDRIRHERKPTPPFHP